MATIVDFFALSHSPFWDLSLDVEGPGADFVAGVREAKDRLAATEFDLVLVFGPDHMRNYFYGLMPSFCVGIDEVEGFGDYGTYGGALPYSKGIGTKIAEGLHANRFDPAFSLRMGVDHGIVQPYEVCVPERDVPILPIMINCMAPPRPTLRRSYEIGQQVGEIVRGLPDDLRVLLLGSGGLSHWVKGASPYDEATDEATREFLIDGRATIREYNKAREDSVVQRMAEKLEGKVNEDWDRWFLDRLDAGDIESILETDEAEMELTAGNGANEVRTWMAAIGAWGGPVQTIAYEPTPLWSTGMGIIGGVRK